MQRKVGQRGDAIKNNYVLKIIVEDIELHSQNYSSIKEIADDINLPHYSVTRIFKKKYKNKKRNLDPRIKYYVIEKI